MERLHATVDAAMSADVTRGDQSTPASPASALAVLRDLERRLSATDGVRYFNRIYVEVTRQVIAMIARGGAQDPGFLAALLDGFVGAYEAAVRADEQSLATVPLAWRPLFQARNDVRVAAVQFVLAGANAHINYDLPVQIARCAVDRGIALDGETVQRADFEAMNVIFARVEADAKRWLLRGLLSKLDRLLGRVDDAVELWSLDHARDAAWSNAVTLWRLHDDPAHADRFRATLADFAGAFGRGLLFPSTPGLRRRGDRLRATGRRIAAAA
jgi:Family of unknown function (DUF5995)